MPIERSDIYDVDGAGLFIGLKPGVVIESLCNHCWWRLPGEIVACLGYDPIPDDIYYGFRDHRKHLTDDHGTLFRRKSHRPTPEEVQAVARELAKNIQFE